MTACRICLTNRGPRTRKGGYAPERRPGTPIVTMLIPSLFLTETPTSSAYHLSGSPSRITHLPPEVVLVHQVHRPHGLDHHSATVLADVAFPLSTSTYTPTVHHPVLLPLQNQKINTEVTARAVPLCPPPGGASSSFRETRGTQRR
jgi:hypothetical protein